MACSVAACLLAALVLVPVAWGQSPPGTEITNTAQATYNVGNVQGEISHSNMVIIVTAAERTPSTVEFLCFAPDDPEATSEILQVTYYSSSGMEWGPFEPVPFPALVGNQSVIDISDPVPLVETSVYHQGEPIFLRLTDLDQNLDPLVAETVLVDLRCDLTGDRELLQLTETGPNTGRFTGYVPSVVVPSDVATDGELSVTVASELTVNYVDRVDPGDVSLDQAWVDPLGMVFDSETGLPVNGAEVTLFDDVTGEPAAVVGEDGVSEYPATVVTGGTVTDSGGTVYSMAAGGYRFPFVAPGSYRLLVSPPPGYTAPSVVPTSQLQALPGGPFTIVEPGSRGESFVIDSMFLGQIDIPIDPAETRLSVEKTASQNLVAIGDFIQYELRVQNQSEASVAGVTVQDHLPLGFRYQAGSARLDGQAIADPEISPDGGTLVFQVGEMAGGVTSAIRYILEVGAGAPLGEATNTAWALDGAGSSSNQAQSAVQVREDLIRSHSFIMGRVIVDNCGDEPDTLNDGLAGVRVFLEDGTFAATDDNGMYHFEGLEPGTHVVQLDTESLPDWYEVTTCEENTRFAGRNDAQFVDLQGGTMWRADFHVTHNPPPPAEGLVGLKLSSVLNGYSVGYKLEFEGQTVPLRNLRLTIMLPDSVAYRAESSILADGTQPIPEIRSGTLIYRLGATEADWSNSLVLGAAIDQQRSPGEMVTRAVLTFDTPTAKNQYTPVVENRLVLESKKEVFRKPDIVLRPRFGVLSAKLTSADKALLDEAVEQLKQRSIVHLDLAGHTDSDRIRKRSQHIFANNYQLSYARAKSVAEYLTEALDLSPDQITLEGRGPDDPVASNATADGKFMNRRVELRVENEQKFEWTFLDALEKQNAVTAPTMGLRPGENWAEEQAAVAAPAPTTENKTIDETWVEDLESGQEWLWPEFGYSPPIPSVKVAVKHDPGQKPVLLLDGVEVSLLNFDKTRQNKAGTLAVSFWTGVDLHEGDNHLEVILNDGNGKETGRLDRTLHYSSPPVFAQFVPEKSTLVADGRTPPVAVFRLQDKDGHVARPGVIGAFSVDPPYAAQFSLEAFQENPLSGKAQRKPVFEVGEDGLVKIELQATSQAGEAIVRFPFENFEQELRVWLESEPRDWILVGLAEGTAGYIDINGHLENAEEKGLDADYFADGRLAFFAKGQIKGKYLLTVAYDTAKQEQMVGNTLFQVIDPDSYYTLYGDATQQGYEAASARKLYVKLERKQFYALFGDYNTGLTVTELARYSRSFNGGKVELKTNGFNLNAFVSQTPHTFQRDEIRGDGTSGLYHLTYGDMVINSEKIIIETRDRFRSEIILSSRSLARHVDYAIDYDAGTLFFREPIFSQDEGLNPIFIVVDYETGDSQDDYLNYGGRGAVLLADKKVEVGASYIHEESQAGKSDMAGVDARYYFTPSTELKGEFATSETGNSGPRQAYLGEFIKRSGDLDGRLYYREQESGFGLGQQNQSEAGRRKMGLDLNYHINPALEFRSLVYRQVNLASEAERDMGEAKLTYSGKRFGGLAGLRFAEDRMAASGPQQSKQLTAGASMQALNSRLTLKLDHDQSLGSDNQSADYPTRTSVGADYQLRQGITLMSRYEITNGARQNTQGARVGLRASPWSGSEINTSLDQKFSENGNRAFANLGLRQSWQIDQQWSVSGGLDFSHATPQTLPDSSATNIPAAFGSQSDFVATTFGVNYRGDNLQWNTRLEFHFADLEDRWTLAPNVLIEPKKGLGLAASGRVFVTDSALGQDKAHADLRLGLAYRPRHTKWIVLNRLDLIFDEQNGLEMDSKSWRIINNLNLNYKARQKTQIAFQYGAKYVGANFDGLKNSGFTHLIGVEARHDFTPRWDVGLRQSLLHSWNSGQFDDCTGLSVGCNVFENAWASLGYNVTGFSDKDFSAAGFSAHGLYLQFRMKFASDVLNLMGPGFASGLKTNDSATDDVGR